IAAASTVCFYEHCLVFDREIALVWRRPWTPLQILVLFNQYMAQASILYLTLGAQGYKFFMLAVWCKISLVYFGIVGLLSAASVQFALLFRVYSLWDNRRFVKLMLTGGFIVCYGIAVVASIEDIRVLEDQLMYIPQADVCSLKLTSDFMIGIWSGILSYDIFVLCLLIANALSRPRRQNFEIIRQLGRDGVMRFIVGVYHPTVR
ncbi:hypothetical protein WOLCODRAFT_83674, partial [Wolfiporia cocos MD-104 SS10]